MAMDQNGKKVLILPLRILNDEVGLKNTVWTESFHLVISAQFTHKLLT